MPGKKSEKRGGICLINRKFRADNKFKDNFYNIILTKINSVEEGNSSFV